MSITKSLLLTIYMRVECSPESCWLNNRKNCELECDCCKGFLLYNSVVLKVWNFFSFFLIEKSVKSKPKNNFFARIFQFFFSSPTGENLPQRKKKTLNLLYVLASYCQIVTFALGCLGSKLEIIFKGHILFSLVICEDIWNVWNQWLLQWIVLGWGENFNGTWVSL